MDSKTMNVNHNYIDISIYLSANNYEKSCMEEVISSIEQ